MATPVAALIVRVAADLAELKTSVNDIDQTLGKAATVAKTVGTAIAAAFSVDAIAGAARAAMDATGQIQDAAEAVGISAEAVQRLTFAAEQGGGTFDQVAVAVRTMAGHLHEPGKGATAALGALNLNLDDLRKLAPDEAFLEIADAIREVPDPLKQSALAQELLGTRATDLLPAIKAGFADIGAQAPLMSDAVVQAGATMGDEWDKTQQRIETLKAQALIPLLETFTSMPTSVQTGIGALVQMAPAFSNIGIAIMAAGGPTAAIGVLKTALSGLSVLLTLPAGAIAAAVVGLVVVFMKWDEIKAIAQRVYTAVKEWLLDRFTAVIDGIKQKIEAVTGFFGDMYDKVVGNSFVPDMMKRIGQEFGSLEELMVLPARLANDLVKGIFDDAAKFVTGTVEGWLQRIGLDMRKFVDEDVPDLARRASEGGRGVRDSFMSGLGEGLEAGIAGIVSSAVGWLGGQIGDWITGGEEARSVNPARDAFLARFGDSGTGEGSGFLNLAGLLTSITGQAGGGAAFRVLAGAETMDQFRDAVDTITALLRQGGVPGFAFGTPGLGFMNFGGGRMAMLHGREAVVPEGRAGDFAARHMNVAGIESRLDRLSRVLVRELPLAVEAAVRHGAQTAGRRL